MLSTRNILIFLFHIRFIYTLSIIRKVSQFLRFQGLIYVENLFNQRLLFYANFF